MSETKQCRRCGAEKEENQFHVNPKTKDGLMHMCKECWNEVKYNRKKETIIEWPLESSFVKVVKETDELPFCHLLDETLLDELKKRGYSGTLTLHKEVTI